MRFEVTAPAEGHAGEVAGVHFARGRAVVDTSDPQQRAALAYFKRRGYGVTEAEGRGEQPSASRPPQAADKAAWVAYAVACGAEQADAEAATKAVLIEQYGKDGA